MPFSDAPALGRARQTCAFAAATMLLCACLMSAAVLVPAPVAALPLLVPVCLGLPVLAALEVPDAVSLLRAAREAGLNRRHLLRLRRQLDRIPETSHPLDLQADVSRLPPPDPNESHWELALRRPLPAATAVFPHGATDPATHRFADRFLDLRPGLLIVLHRP